MKRGIRIAAAASGPIRGRENTLLVLVVYREGIIEGVLSTNIGIDSSDSTKKLISMIKGSRFIGQIRLLALNGIALAGLNIVDVNTIKKALALNFIVLTRKKPHKKLLIEAIDKRKRNAEVTTDKEAVRKIRIIETVGKLKIVKSAGFYIQSDLDIGKEDKGLVRTAFEALRIAHLIANGIETGESKGRI